MCFTFLPSCFGAIRSPARYPDWGGDCNTVMPGECCLGLECQASASQQDLGAAKEGGPAPRKLQDGRSGRPPRSSRESLTASLGGAVSLRQSTAQILRLCSGSTGAGEEIVVRKRVNGDIAPRRNSWRDRAMIKLNFCVFFCRGWWAFLLLQFHMLQALAQGNAIWKWGGGQSFFSLDALPAYCI